MQSSARDNDDNTKGLAIGLGVGIPLGLALVGGVIFVGLQLRKWAVATAQQRPMDNKEGGEEGRASSLAGGSNLSNNVREGEETGRMQQQFYRSELTGY